MKEAKSRRKSNEAARACGRTLAPLFCGFVRYIMESAAERGAARVHYFTREGDFLAPLHEAIAARNDSRRFPAAAVLPVSRLSTFAGTLREVSATEFRRMWRLYPNQSFGAFLKSLALPADRVARLLPEFDLNLEDPIPGIEQDGRVRRIIQDARFRAVVEEQIRHKRRLLDGFLTERGIGPDTEDVVVADLGWAGTIQNNLAWFRPNTHFHGVYFGTARSEGPLPPNVSRRCYLDDMVLPAAADRVRRAFLRDQPLEFLCGSPLGTVTGYTEREGRVAPVREPDARENVTFETFTRFFQQGVFDRVEELAREGAAAPRGTDERPVRRLLRELYYNPPRPIADAYKSFHHAETYGLGGSKTAKRRIPVTLVLASLFSRRSRRRLTEWANSTGWLAGFLVASRLRPLQWLLNRLRWPFLFDGAFCEAPDRPTNEYDNTKHVCEKTEKTTERAA